MLDMTSEGNFFIAYMHEAKPESLNTGGKLASEGESVRSKPLEAAAYV